MQGLYPRIWSPAGAQGRPIKAALCILILLFFQKITELYLLVPVETGLAQMTGLGMNCPYFFL